MSEFVLHPQLARDTVLVHQQRELRLLLMNDQRYPWLLLVPCVEHIREWHDLSESLRTRLFRASVRLGEQMLTLFQGEKLNVAMIGNRVDQFHLHHVLRRSDDDAWPDPVWGYGQSVPYAEKDLHARLAWLRHSLDFCRQD